MLAGAEGGREGGEGEGKVNGVYNCVLSSHTFLAPRISLSVDDAIG